MEVVGPQPSNISVFEMIQKNKKETEARNKQGG
jgi:hypothetical protein